MALCAFGHLATLCAADRQELLFVDPLRADTGWAERFDADVGNLDALARLDHVAERERIHPVQARTGWRGLLAPVPATDPNTGGSQHQSAGRRDRALAKAEQALGKVRNGLIGRYKTVAQVQAKRPALHGRIEALIYVDVGADEQPRSSNCPGNDQAAPGASVGATHTNGCNADRGQGSGQGCGQDPSLMVERRPGDRPR